MTKLFTIFFKCMVYGINTIDMKYENCALFENVM